MVDEGTLIVLWMWYPTYLDTYIRRYTIEIMTMMKKVSLYIEEEQIAKLMAISENSSVPLPFSNQVRAAIDDYCKVNSRGTRGWERQLRKMRETG